MAFCSTIPRSCTQDFHFDLPDGVSKTVTRPSGLSNSFSILFISQRHQRVHAHSPPRRNVACSQGNDSK